MEVGRKKKQPKRLFPSTVPTNIPLGVKPEEFPQIYPQGSTRRDFLKYTLTSGGQTRRDPTNTPSLRGVKPEEQPILFSATYPVTATDAPAPRGPPACRAEAPNSSVHRQPRSHKYTLTSGGQTRRTTTNSVNHTKAVTQQHTRLINHDILFQGRDHLRLSEGEGEGSNPGLLPVPLGSRHSLNLFLAGRKSTQKEE